MIKSVHIYITQYCKILGTETTENWYSHIPKPVCQHEDITVLWNQGVQTDREVLANRPDIIIKNKKDKICLLINVAIPSDRNVVQKESENKLKHKNLSIEIQRMWNMKCFVIPVIIGATGIITRGLKKISGNNTRKEFNRFSTKSRCTRDITHYKESATIRNVKPEWWGSPLVQEEKYQEKTCEKIIRNNNNNVDRDLMNMEAIRCSEILETTYKTTGCYNPEDQHLQH
jgi:hypothetical protein